MYNTLKTKMLYPFYNIYQYGNIYGVCSLVCSLQIQVEHPPTSCSSDWSKRDPHIAYSLGVGVF